MKNTPICALMHRAQTHPKSAAFIFRQQVWTYERLAVEAQHLARGMASRAVGPGDRVALHMMNRPEMIVAYYACFLLGAIAAPLRTAFKFAELEPLLQRLKPALYIGEIGLYENVAAVDVSTLALNRRFIVNKTFEDDRVEPWEALFEGMTNEVWLTPQASYQPSVLISTSGTTGRPKFVMHTPETLFVTTEMMFKYWEFWEDDVAVEPLAMAHMSGLVTFLCYIQFGISFILLESFDADTVLDAMERYGCTRYLGFPASMPRCSSAKWPGRGI